MLPTTALTTTTGAVSVAIADRLREHAEDARGAYSPATERALRGDMATFSSWCAERGWSPLPALPSTVAAYIDDQGERLAVATIARHVSSISTAHRAAGCETPTTDPKVRLALRRLRRAKGTAQRQATALNRPVVERMLLNAGAGVAGLRNAALLAISYDLFSRRSELVALDAEDITTAADGSRTATIRRSKTDQAGAGSVRYLAPDTMRRLRAYMDAAGITSGALFRSMRRGGVVSDRRLTAAEVSRLLRVMAAQAGVMLEGISGHSTRIGAAQDAAAAGIGMPAILQAGGWRSAQMVTRYVRGLDAKRSASARLAAMQDRN